MGDTDKNGKRDFFRMFRRKKKRKKEFLLGCLKELSLTAEEQTRIIKALTEQNTQDSQDMKRLQESVVSITSEVQRLNEKNSNLVDKLETTESQLRVNQKELEIERERERMLKATNTELSTALEESDKNLGDLQMQAALYQEKSKSADEKNDMLNILVAELKDSLKVTKSEHMKLHIRFKMMEKDLQHRKEIADLEKKLRLDAQRRLDELRQTLDSVRLHDYSLQLNLDAENECLKFDVHALTKKVKKMKDELNEMRRDKFLIMSYYTRQRNESSPKHTFNVNLSDTTHRNLIIDTIDGSLVQNNWGVEDEIHPDVLENITLKNKLMSLESRLYKREQLIDELVRVIQEHDPSFNLQDQASFKLYFEEANIKTTTTNTSKDNAAKQTNYDDVIDDIYSSTISYDNLDEYLN